MIKQLRNWLRPAAALPSKWRDLSWNALPFLAIDLELNDLDTKVAKILSIGWVEGRTQKIEIANCFYQVISTTASLNQSPVIHGLIADDIDKGERLNTAIEQLYKFADTHIWVFHNSGLDMPMLNQSFADMNMPLPTIVTLDTLQLALYQLKKQHQLIPPNAATLSSCRQRYNLPLAPAHNALDDAMASLELLFAQLHALDPLAKQGLKALTHTGAIKIYESTLKSNHR